MKLNFLVIPFLAFTIVSCSSKHKVKDLDTEMEEKGRIGDSKIGVDDDGNAVIQSEQSAEIALRRQLWINNDLEDKLTSEHEDLKRCRTEVADPRLGGNESFKDLPEVDDMESPDEVREEMGLTEDGSLKLVKKEMYLDRLEKERTFASNLRQMVTTVKKYREQCERELGYARTKKGLPANRKTSKGTLDSKGNFHQTEESEKSLDDVEMNEE